MKVSLCIDLLKLEITQTGPLFADTQKLLDGMELAKKAGYSAIEFWDWDTRDYEALLAKKNELALELATICAKDRGTLADPSTFDMAIKGLKETIEVAKLFDCKNIIVTAQPNDAFSQKEGFENVVEGLKLMAPIAEENDVVLIFEPIAGAFFTDFEKTFQVIEEVGSEHVKLLYDIYHYQLMQGNIANNIKNHINKIGHIHAASVPDRAEIFNGELDYEYLIKVIKEAGYNEYFGIEYRTTMDHESSVILTKKFLNDVIK